MIETKGHLTEVYQYWDYLKSSSMKEFVSLISSLSNYA